jgi:hypothetical protein
VVAIDKSSGDCASEVIGDSWPTESEDSYSNLAKDLLQNAGKAQKAAQVHRDGQQYAESETDSKTTEELQRQSGLHITKHLQQAEDFAKASGWAKYSTEAIKAAKSAMNAAAEAHELMHDLPTITEQQEAKGAAGATQKAKDADLQSSKDLVSTAKRTLDSALSAADRAVTSDAIPAPFAGTPEIPDAEAPKQDAGQGADSEGIPELPPSLQLPSEMSDGATDSPYLGSGSDTDGTTIGDGFRDPGIFGPGNFSDDGVPSLSGEAPRDLDSSSGLPSDFTPPGTYSPGNMNPGLTPLAPGMPAAPAAPAVPAAPAPSASAPPSSMPKFSAPEAPGAGAGAEGGGGQKPGGMPAGSQGLGSAMPAGMGQQQMPMQPPQAPQSPGGGGLGEMTKPFTDAMGKMGGGGEHGGDHGGGVPVSEHQMDKLLAAQNADNGGGNGGQGPDGGDDGNGNGPDGGGDGKHDGHDGDGKGDGKHDGVHTQFDGPRHMDPYSSANTNPGLNNPSSSFGGAPSPAAPVTTGAPAVSAPVTELSADPAAPGAPVSQQAGLVQPATVEQPAAHGHNSAAANSLAPSPVAGQPPAGGALAEYPTGGPAPAAGMGGMPMMPPMGGGAVGGGSGSVSPVLAAVPATVGGAIVAREVSSSKGRTVPNDSAVERILGLPPEHAAAENQLAGLVKVFRQRGWESTRLAVGVFAAGDVLQPRLRYILATSDALSLLPLGISAPAGMELLSAQPVRATFAADWNGNQHAGRKLAALANKYESVVGRLVYLVSNDPDAILFPGQSGDVKEVVQGADETSALIAQHRAAPAVSPRVEIARNLPIREDDAVAALTSFGELWGFQDATADDLDQATAMLWAMRWGRGRDRKDELPAITATYLYVEGLQAIRDNRPADVAYAASAMLSVRPDSWR